jgi:hypothetical protein
MGTREATRRVGGIWPTVILLVFVGLLIANMNRNPVWEETGTTSVVVERSSGALGLAFNSRAEINGGKASLDYDKREIIIKDPINIRGWYGDSGYVVAKMDFNQNELVMHIPDDAEYRISISGQKHILTKTAKKETIK